MTELRYRFSEKGVSESIGFILIFSIMMAGIGLVTLYGYPLLMQQQSNANEQIMEKNMIVLQNDLKSLVYKTVPYKESALSVGGGSLTIYNVSTTPAIFTIDITNCGSTHYGTPFMSGDLRYSSNSAGTDISLQNGAVVLRPQVSMGSINGSAMLAQPRWFYDNQTNTLVINLMSFNSTNLMSLAGIGTVGTALGATNYTYVNIPAGTSPTLCVAYTPNPVQDYSVAWDNYFMNTLNNPPDISVSRSGTPGAGAQLTYSLTIYTRPMTLVVKKYDVLVKSL
jgi:hypothetical protein